MSLPNPRALLALSLLVFACNSEENLLADQKPPLTTGDPNQALEAGAPGKKVVQPPLAAEAAPAESKRLETQAPLDRLRQVIPSYFDGNLGRRLYVQLDKPLYKPGETIWFRSWDLIARDLSKDHPNAWVRFELISPKGAVVLKKNVAAANGLATNDFELPDGVQGGEYQLRATTSDGKTTERPLIVSTYEPPRVKKKLEFVRKAYGAGDEVTATLELKRPTGEPLANLEAQAVIRLDDVELPRVKVQTNAEGGALVRFTLPTEISRGDGLLTVLVDDGGVTESVSKSIPIILKKLEFSFYPEGGQVVVGQKGRMYFEAKNPIGKPADVEGRVVDDHGNAVSTFRSYHDGLGRFDFKPATGRTYVAEITQPVGITEKYALPLAVEDGCSLRSFDDLDGQEPTLRLSVSCTSARKVYVVGMVRENLFDAAAVLVPQDGAAIVHLKAKDTSVEKAQGIARVTVFDEQLTPLAERLVFRNRRARLSIEVKPDQDRYGPREQVALKITTRGPDGQPVPAEVAVSVVDDTVIAFADDKTGHMLSKLLLESEIPGKVEEPNVYFDLTEKKSATAMDLLMGTRGWRRFEWAPVLAPPSKPMSTAGFGGDALEGEADAIGGLGLGGKGRGGGGRQMARRAPADAPVDGAAKQEFAAMAEPPMEMPEAAAAGMAMAKPRAEVVDAPAAPAAPAPRPPPPEPRQHANKAAVAPEPEGGRIRAVEAPREAEALQDAKADDRQARDQLAGPKADVDEDWDGAENKKMRAVDDGRDDDGEDREAFVLSPVRVYPAPVYDGVYEGPRVDFRETLHWAPSIKTGKDGQATFTFYLSDAVTSLRVFAEGAGASAIGRHEEVLSSSLPFSMNIKLPVEVSAGDRLLLPLTLTNERDRALPVKLETDFGDLLRQNGSASLAGPLAPNARESLYFPLEVTGTSGKSKVRIAAVAGSLTDEFIREVNVVPLGFPMHQQQAGNLSERVTATFDLGQATPGTINASIKLYPSPVATIVSGLDGMLREPSGCFEQTSSTNYPNVMVLQYLKAADVADPALVQRAGSLIDRGYQRLVSFEANKKGYEWFGNSPAHEALTAYGLAEFADMKRVYGSVDDDMLDRTASWLKSRRNGKGGFSRDGQALDTFGSASPEVTDAYIVYSLAKAGMVAGFPEELAVQSKRAAETKDPYLLALAANTLLTVPAHKAQGVSAADRLASMQKPDGLISGADHSITRSGGQNLNIETTALGALAFMRSGAHADHTRRAIEWLNGNRGGFGQWGATQSTVLALEAMTEYALASRQTLSPGAVTVLVNGQKVGDFAYAAGHRDTIDFHSLGAHFKAGSNSVEVLRTGASGESMPYTVVVEYRSQKPATSPDVVVELKTTLDRSTVKMGETVRLKAVLTNRTSGGQPMTMARIGIPGGLSFQTWQLKELKDKGLVDQWETQAREVIFYFREMKPSQVRELPIDLVATIPGDYTSPASSAYLYYTDDRKFWTDAVKISITR